MALTTPELKWLKDNMGKPLTDIVDMPSVRGMCLSDKCAIEEDGYLFATHKGQRLMAYYQIS